jgi:hypothetical protein
VNVVVIRDGDGNQWNVQLMPPPPRITGPTNYLNLSDDNLDASDNLKVVFEAASDQSFGFDKKEYAAFIDNYEAIKLPNNKIYFVPNKSIGESSTDAVIATFTLAGYSSSQLSFKTRSGTPISATASGNNLKLSEIPSDAICVYAYCDNKKIGKLNIVSLKSIGKKLVLVPVNNANTNITAAQLNDIYKQANVTWSVTTAPNFSFNLGNDGLEAADANLLTKYSSEMRSLRDAYKAAHSDYDKEAYYLFVVPNFSANDLRGYMVRGRALGFIKTGTTPKEIAHELGHGAFSMPHTFPELQKESTDNLMDYGSGINLVKEQWERVSEEINVLNWLDNEEDASLFGFDLEKYLKDKFGIQCYETYKNYDGIIPQCFWNNSVCNSTLDKCYGTAMICGIVDGVFVTVKDIFNIAEFVNCWTPVSATYNTSECVVIQEKTIQTVNAIKEICNDPNGGSQIYTTIKNSLGDWALSTFCTDKTCAYNQGRLIFDVVSLFYGVGEAKALLKTGIAGTKIAQIITEVDKTAVCLVKAFSKIGNKLVRIGGIYYMYVKVGGSDFTVGTINSVKKAINIKIPFVKPSTTAVVKAELRDVNYLDVVDGKEIIRKGDIDIIEEGGVAKAVSKNVNTGLEDLFTSARKRAIEKFGSDAEYLIYVKFNKDGGAAAEIIDHFGPEGINVLKNVNNIQDAASQLLNGKTAYRHISSTAPYINSLKTTGKIPSQTGLGTTYFSLDKYDDPLIAIDKMQLNAAGTDATWRIEFDAVQLSNKVQFPKGKWNNAEYIEVLTRSYPNFGLGGATQFVTQSEITLKRMVNLKTGEIINF